jgi:hypothetical protein
MPAGVTVKTNTVKDAGGNTIWTSDGSGTLSSVNSALQGNMIFISSQTASASASLSFTSGLTSTYDEYVFYFVNINPVTDATHFEVQASTDGGSSYGLTKTTTYFHTYHYEGSSSASLQYNNTYDVAQATTAATVAHNMDADADSSGGGELHLFNPSSTTYVKHFYSTTAMVFSGTGAGHRFAAGYWNTTNDIDAIQFKMSSGNFDGTIAMYGIR